MSRPRIAAFAGALIIGSLAAPLAATPAFAAPRASEQGTYIVKDGDSLFGIALKLKVRLSDLLATNDLTITSVIHPGDTLDVPPHSPAATAAAQPPAPTKADKVVAFALAQVGKPYKFAATGPDAYDCSGLVTAAFKQVGIKLPAYSVAQSMYGTAVEIGAEPLRAGDLVFLYDRATGVIDHVGIAINSTQWVQAVGTGDTVRVTKLPTTRIAAVRRILSD